jgi:hypothetical protein
MLFNNGLDELNCLQSGGTDHFLNLISVVSHLLLEGGISVAVAYLD